MERAGLHRRIDTRVLEWRQVAKRIDTALLGGYLGSQRLKDLAYVVPVFDGENMKAINAGRKDFMNRFAATSAAAPRFLVLGELKDVELDAGVLSARLKNLPHGDFLKDELKARLVQRYGYAPLAHCSNRQSAILGLFLVERDGAQKMLHVVDGALTLVSRDYIPCDSGYEVHMANWMMDDGRKFEKPMRPERRTGKIPDFVLRDTEPETYLEVWGRDDDKYNESKAEKLSLYRSNGMRLWQWNARRDRFPPPLPEPCKYWATCGLL